MILEETSIGSSKPFLGTFVLPEHCVLSLFLNVGRQTVSLMDGGELIPPLGGQTGEELVLGPGALEWWDHQAVV